MRTGTRTVLYHGLLAALAGYATIVILFAAINLIQGRSVFYTAALFGSAMFYGLEDPSDLVITWTAILNYNMFHALVFVVLGLLASWLVTFTEKYPVVWLLAVFAVVFVGVHIYTFMVLFTEPLLGTVAWWQIGLASLAAAGVMGLVLLKLHPILRTEIEEIAESEQMA